MAELKCYTMSTGNMNAALDNLLIHSTLQVIFCLQTTFGMLLWIFPQTLHIVHHVFLTFSWTSTKYFYLLYHS